MPDIFRMKCVWKNLLRHLEFRCLPEVRFLIFVSDLRILELAKGFEPLTP
jgi:hypothetical protein